MAPRPQVVIADPALTVEPGRRVGTRIRIRNTGRQVAHYRLSMVEACQPAAWAAIANTEVKLNPGADTDVVVHFEPPRDTQTRAGTFPYGVRVQPGPDDGQLPTVAEADLTVGAITAIDVGLRPKRSAGRWSGRHRVVLHNRGTEDLQVRLRAFDDDEKLSVAIVPQSVTVPAGGTGEALLRVRARTPMVLGARQSLPFHVSYRRRAGSGAAAVGPTEGGEVEATVDGTYDHKPIVTKSMLGLGAAAVAVVGFLGWRFLQPGPAEPGPPPRAPTAFGGEPLGDGLVQLSFQTDANAATVLLRLIDCGTRDDPLPEVVDGELGEVDVRNSRRGRAQVGPFDLGVPLCFQARAVTAEGSVSVWTPEVFELALGPGIPPAPEGLAVVAGDGPGTAEVSWDPVDAAGNVRYDLLVDGRSLDPNGIASTNQTLTELTAGQHEVRVQTVLEDGTRSPLSDPQTVVISEGAGAPDSDGDGEGEGDGGPGGGGSDGPGGGGDEGDEDPDQVGPGPAPPTPEGFFAVILPEGGSGEPQIIRALDLARRGDPLDPDDDSFPAAERRVVGIDVALPGLGLEPGQTIVMQDRFESADEVVARCIAYRTLVEQLLAEGQAGPASGLSLTCQAYPPYED